MTDLPIAPKGNTGGAPHAALLPRRHARAGFTLLELCVVMFIIALVAAIAVPSLLPAIVFSELEGSARHLAGFGRAILAEAAFQREDITIRFDMDAQQYYAIRLVYPQDEAGGEGEGEGEVEEDQWAKLRELQEAGKVPKGDSLAESLASGKENVYPEDFDQELADQQMQDRVYRYARSLNEARARNVKHEDSFLEEVGPLFDKEYASEEMQPTEEELGGPTLGRSRVPESVTVDTIEIDGEALRKGVVEFQVGMLGFTQEVVFYLINEDGDAFTVVWDPVSGNTNAAMGDKKPV
ncbi:MAG: type II secretion system protein [Candidatus Hydrogenedentes bacterium]|nr:type II secretion system protein [Candidatus Hydrogenedentota bacterium]